MSILKLKPALKNNLWGGRRLIDEFHYEYDGDICAEAWVLSAHPDGPSVIAEGKYAGRTLNEFIAKEGFEVLGTNCRRFREFPILVKFIDARDDLSIQVHPSNGYALRNENQYGKTEMWYVLDAEPGSYLYYGFENSISKEEFRERIENNTLIEVLNKVEVHKGDTFFIESGTLHAIGKGILIAEIQQNSNVTYRIYDYGRIDKNGKPRDLHVEKALAVTNRVHPSGGNPGFPHLADCDYFTVDHVNLDGVSRYRMQGTVTESSFLSVLVLEGEGSLTSRGEKVTFVKGDSIMITAGSGDYQLEGKCNIILTTIREKANPMRVGVIIGSYETEIGLIDENNNLLSQEKFLTRPERGSKAILDEVSEEILSILENNGVPLEQCVGVGVGVPGTIDRKKGKVIYSNNIRWDNVALVEELGSVIPCPVRIANDADCAALGEQIAGAGKDYSEVVMFTLGNGVGGGIILNGHIFEGGIMGGSELGHMAVKTDGRECTCGRKGCLEAYASIPALLEAAAREAGQELSLREVFEQYQNNDETMVRVVKEYIHMLGTGVVNIVNIFRPQLVLLGGNLSPYVHLIIDDIREMMKKESFGGDHSDIPELKEAQLGSEAGIIGAANL